MGWPYWRARPGTGEARSGSSTVTRRGVRLYLSLRDRPGTSTEPHDARRPPVGRVVVTLGVVSLLTDISSESVASILPLYLTAVVGLSPAAFGLVDGLYQGMSALVRVVSGWGADRTGHPKWVAMAGYGLSFVARIFLLFAGGLAAISSVLAVDRIGKGIRTAPRDAMISAAADPAHLGRAFGVHRSLDTVGAAIGPLLAALILWAIPDGYGTVLVMSLCFAFLGVALLGLLVPSGTGARTPARAPVSEFRWRDVATPSLRRLLVVAGVLGLLTVGDGFLYLVLLDSTEFDPRWFPVLYVGTNVAYLALAVPLGRLADRVGRTRVLVLGHLALAAAYLCAALPLLGAATAVVTLALLGTFYAATDGVLAAVAGRVVPAHLRASGIASAQTVVVVARMLASVGFGLLWFALGPTVAMVALGAVLAAVVPVALATVGRLDEPAPA